MTAKKYYQVFLGLTYKIYKIWRPGKRHAEDQTFSQVFSNGLWETWNKD